MRDPTFRSEIEHFLFREFILDWDRRIVRQGLRIDADHSVVVEESAIAYFLHTHSNEEISFFGNRRQRNKVLFAFRFLGKIRRFEGD